jgi:hypothetical protein
MMNGLSRTYVYLLAVLLSVLVAGLLALHIAYLAGTQFQPNGLFYALFFGVNLPVLSLAENRNIWANEVQQSPAWLRWSFRGLFAYAMVVMLLCIVGNMHVSSNFFLAASAFMLMFTVGSACVLYATIRASRTDVQNLRDRTKRSILSVALFATLYLGFSFLPKSIHH